MYGVIRQIRLVLGCFRALLANPLMLVYPVLIATLGLGGAVAVLGYGYLGITGAVPFNDVLLFVAFAAYMIVVPLVISFFGVAYAYEVNVAFEGSRPVPGSGVLAAARRFKLVLIGALVLGPGYYLLRHLQGFGPVGEIVGSTSSTALRVVSVFAFPVIATSDGAIRETFDDLVAAVEDEWGKALITTVGTKTLGMVIAWGGILSGAGLAVAWFLDYGVPSVGPWGPFTLPVALAVGGLWISFALTFTVNGVVQTALYRYTIDGEFPAALGSDPDSLVEEQSEQPSPFGGPA